MMALMKKAAENGDWVSPSPEGCWEFWVVEVDLAEDMIGRKATTMEVIDHLGSVVSKYNQDVLHE